MVLANPINKGQSVQLLLYWVGLNAAARPYIAILIIVVELV